MAPELTNAAQTRLGALTLRPSTCELVHEQQTLSIEPQVMRVLLELAQHQGAVVSRDQLVAHCWGGRSVSEDAINRVISRIRRLSETTGAFQLRTVRKVGYRVEAAVLPVPLPDADFTGVKTLPATPVSERSGRYHLFLGFIAAICFVMGIGGAVWFGLQPHMPTIRVIGIAQRDAEDAKLADEVDQQLRTTLSHMRGLRLIEKTPPEDGKATDLILSHAVTGAERAPVISLILTDGHTGVRVWGARFDGRIMADPSAKERAVSAAARYLAVWLGDGLGETSGAQTAAREPESHEIARLVAIGRRTFARAGRARHNRDWEMFERLMQDVDVVSKQALALDPESAGALMLQYQINVAPEYVRPGESEARFKARRRDAERYLSQALASNPDNPEVLVAAGEDFKRSLQWQSAERLLSRAVAIDPNSVDANTWYAYHLGLMGECAAGLKYARIAAALMPEDSWRQMAVPRLLHCAGRREEASGFYMAILQKDPGNVFVLRELYLMRLAQRNAEALKALSVYAQTRLLAAAPSEATRAMIARIDAAAAALEGRPKVFLEMLGDDHKVFSHMKAEDNHFGRTQGDVRFVLALEYAEAGARDMALRTLGEAVEQGSLYLPWALPYGPSEFPLAVRQDPAYAALWMSSPGVAELIAIRRKASKKQGLYGV